MKGVISCTMISLIILNLNHSGVQSCASEKKNNYITYFVTLIRKEFIRSSCSNKLSIKDYHNVRLSPQVIHGTDSHIAYKKDVIFVLIITAVIMKTALFLLKSHSIFTTAYEIQMMSS